MSKIQRRVFMMGAATAAVGGQAAAQPGKKYLLIDPRVILRSTGARKALGQVVKEGRNPLFAEDKPWEARFDNLYANVLRDERSGEYRCWYSPFLIDEAVTSTPRAERLKTPYKPRKREMGVCYAVSKDGLRWEKPELGLVEFDGSRRNNIVSRGPHGAGLWRDDLEKDPRRRYKMFFRGKTMAGLFSADGLRWEEPTAFSAIDAPGDTHNNWFWSPERNAYVGITRLSDRQSRQRLVGRTESRDFVTWTKAEEVLRALPSDGKRQAYAMPVFSHSGLYFGLLMMFDSDTDRVHCELALSTDTVTWERVCPGVPLIGNGVEGAYDWGCVYAAARPVVLDNGEIRLYYGASNGKHTSWRDGFFCLARLRPDGFAGLEAESAKTVARVVTAPVTVSGKRLTVTADAANGSIRAGIVGDVEKLGIDRCVAVKGDVTGRRVEWKGATLQALGGRQVQIEFELSGAARLYSFGFEG